MSHRSAASSAAVPAAVLAAVLGMAGCSGGTTTATGSTSSAPVVTPSSAAAVPSSPSPSTPAAEPVAGGGATTFCAAFKELDSLQGDAHVTDIAAAGARFRAVAVDIRATAPASIKAAANTYADLVDSVGKAAESGTLDEAGLQKAFNDAIAGKAADIGTAAMYVAKNCPGLGS